MRRYRIRHQVISVVAVLTGAACLVLGTPYPNFRFCQPRNNAQMGRG